MKRTLLIGLASLMAACSPSLAPTGTAAGTYRIDGIDAKLGFARTAKGDPYMKRPTIDAVFSEKDSAAAKDLRSISFGNTYGANISITLYKTEDGSYDVISSSFGHPASKVNGGGSGIVNVKDVKDANGKISGELFTKPDTTMFGQKLEIDVKFEAPLPQ